MKKFGFLEIEDWEQSYMQQKFSDEVALYTDKKVQEELPEEFYTVEVLSPFIYSALSADTLKKFPNLKCVVTRSTGYDHIDLAYCNENNITVCNVPSYGAHTVAEHTFALILALSRKLLETVDRSRRGNFELNDLTGFDLAGKTIGIVGGGKIGEKVMRVAQAFEMNVLLYTRHPEDVQSTDTLKPATLEELIAHSDIVSLHLPYTKETHHIINRDTIKQFKKGSLLINTARGPLVETQAILDGLESGILAGAGLDVLEEECGLKEERELLTSEYFKTCDIRTQLLDHVLINRNDVLYTSHNGFNSMESVHQILDTTTKNIIHFNEGNPQNTVELHR